MKRLRLRRSIAGDLYDGDWRGFQHGPLLRITYGPSPSKPGSPSILLHGNHDAESVITRRLELPPNVHVFNADRARDVRASRVGSRRPARPELSQSARSLENLVPGYPEPVRGVFNVGVLHTALAGIGGTRTLCAVLAR